MARARVTLTYHGKRLIPGIEAVLSRRLRKVGEMVASEVRKNIGTSTRAEGPSVPGEFPHADTGRLRSSISWDIDSEKLLVRVGTTLEYGAHLELGTEKMEARPFLEPTAVEMQRKVSEIIAAPIRDKDIGPAYLKVGR